MNNNIKELQKIIKNMNTAHKAGIEIPTYHVGNKSFDHQGDPVAQICLSHMKSEVIILFGFRDNRGKFNKKSKTPRFVIKDPTDLLSSKKKATQKAIAVCQEIGKRIELRDQIKTGEDVVKFILSSIQSQAGDQWSNILDGELVEMEVAE